MILFINRIYFYIFIYSVPIVHTLTSMFLLARYFRFSLQIFFSSFYLFLTIQLFLIPRFGFCNIWQGHDIIRSHTYSYIVKYYKSPNLGLINLYCLMSLYTFGLLNFQYKLVFMQGYTFLCSPCSSFLLVTLYPSFHL